MTTKTDKIRAALEYLVDWQSKDGAAVVVEVAQEALSELDGCCVVPVEPTDDMCLLYVPNNMGVPHNDYSHYGRVYRAMIAQYVNGEKK